MKISQLPVFAIIFFLCSLNLNIQAQCTCTQIWPPNHVDAVPPACTDLAGANLLVAEQDLLLVFDSFGKITGGITTSTFLRLKVPDNLVGSTCRWSLYMFINNDADAGAGPTEWAEKLTYGPGVAPKPQLNLIKVRVHNGCGTECPLIAPGNVFPTDKACLPIISDLFANHPAGGCNDNVNGSGDYINNFNEYTFTVDFTITPLPPPTSPDYPLSVRPGQWNVSVEFWLIEEN